MAIWPKSTDSREMTQRATALQNRVSQLKMALRAKNVVHDVLSKEMLDLLDGFGGDLIVDVRPERLRDVR